MRKYTKKETTQKIEEIFESNDISKLYSEDFVNRKGKTSDTKEEYQEIFAEYIFHRLVDNKLPMIPPSGIENYCEHERTYVERDNEEGVQRDYYFGKRKLDDSYGVPVWFELQTGERGQGKGIDLVYYNNNTQELNLFELKYNNSNESLLRAILEIQTYYQRVHWSKAFSALKQARENKDKISCVGVSKINKYILVNKGCFPLYNKYEAIKSLTDSYVKKLLDCFEIKVVIYD
ncbi:MAG: hypothetical protein IKA54_06375 [Clostridia bacterium]|nr:hypothetical protein [Clostridia bacterium]